MSDLKKVAATGQETPRCLERYGRSMCGTKVLKQKSPKIEEAVLMNFRAVFLFLGSGCTKR
jgi:hypothetical protein